jgi:hypothetical protein
LAKVAFREQFLGTGDAADLEDEKSVSFTARVPSEILLFNLNWCLFEVFSRLVISTLRWLDHWKSSPEYQIIMVSFSLPTSSP